MDDEYGEFYKVLTNDYKKYLSLKCFRTKNGVDFTVLLFVSKRALYSFFEPKKKFKNQILYLTCFYHEQLQ
jgi:HSP90 family molecular chaperone